MNLHWDNGGRDLIVSFSSLIFLAASGTGPLYGRTISLQLSRAENHFSVTLSFQINSERRPRPWDILPFFLLFSVYFWSIWNVVRNVIIVLHSFNNWPTMKKQNMYHLYLCLIRASLYKNNIYGLSWVFYFLQFHGIDDYNYTVASL